MDELYWFCMVIILLGGIAMVVFGVDREVDVPVYIVVNDSCQVTPDIPGWNVGWEGDFNEYSGYTLVMNDFVREKLMDSWNNTTEYGLCLKGRLDSENEVFYVNGYDGYVVGDEDSVGIWCSGSGVIGMVHNHPRGSCYMSSQDVLIDRSMIKEGVVLFLIQCSRNETVAFSSETIGMRYRYELGG